MPTYNIKMVQKRLVTRDYENIVASSMEEALEFAMEGWCLHVGSRTSDDDPEFVSAEIYKASDRIFDEFDDFYDDGAFEGMHSFGDMGSW